MILSQIAQYCHNKLNNTARQYLAGRGVSDEFIEAFELGFSPFEVEEMISTLGKDNLLKAGVIFESDEGKIHSLIRNTITFPFVNHHGKVVSVSFRPVQSNEVIKSKNLRKYWHITFVKGSFLYGINRARDAIREQKLAIAVEGQFDVIVSHQFGFTNTIGVVGSDLSAQQIKIISRSTKNLIIVFDGDEAGRRATEKIKAKEIKGLTIKAARLPDGDDVDSFLQSQGTEAYRELLSSAV